MPNVSYFLDDSVVSTRAAEVPDADFAGGVNAGASNACGIGVNADGGAVADTPEQFTLLDQNGDARTPQNSQAVGGAADVLRLGTVSATGDGVVTADGNATLADAAVGWVSSV